MIFILSISNFYNQLNELSFKLKEALSFNFESYVFNTKLNDNELLKIYLNSRQINFKEKLSIVDVFGDEISEAISKIGYFKVYGDK